MGKKGSEGIQSQAGLVRYFDSESDKSLKIGPKFVIGLAVGFTILVTVLNTFLSVA
ncbi:MAG: preprotein translocase subunit Sec61beta [archaeon]|nr:preprotein translocase subunit Sec61beta [archaeon]